MTVWDSLVGQDRALRGLKAAVVDAGAILRGEPGPAMTHAWLITGPPGSGRSNAGLAFAAALQCEQGGCGECHACQTALVGSHANVSVYRPRGAQTYLIDDMREMVLEAARMPSQGRWRVLIVEEADRFGIHGSSYRSAGALLKAIEEPTPRTVWVLSAPTAADTPATIGSRCRHVALVAPSAHAVADLLVRDDGIDPAMAAFAAAASQGHVGRARGLARDEATRVRRAEVVAVPLQTATVGGCLTAAANLVDAAKEDAEASNGHREEAELEALQQEYGLVPGGRRPPGAAGALKDLEDGQKRRRTRATRDSLDRAFLDLVAFYRDVLVLQAGASVPLVNADRHRDLETVASASSPETTLRRIEAVMAARLAIEQNVAPLLAVEAMTLALRAA
jgi:DNA polymerase III subunit delta'